MRPERWIKEGLDRGICINCDRERVIRLKTGLCVPVCEARKSLEKLMRLRQLPN